MREPDSWIVGLAVAVAVWFSAIVGFSLGILLVPVSLPAANFAALAVFSILVFFVGRAWGKRTSSKSKVAWGLAATGWLTPWLCVVSGVHGLSEDLGGVFGAFGAVALVIVVIPASLIRLGLWRALKRNR